MRFSKFVAVLGAVILAAIMLPLTVWATSSVADDQSNATEVLGPNLLTNPGMDGAYVKQCSARNGAPWVQIPCPADYNASENVVKQWETTQVPYGWSAWWRQPNSNFDDPLYYVTWPASCPGRKSTPLDCIAHHNPEYRDTMGGPQETGPSRKVAGDNSQKYFTFYSIHEAGLYQVVGGVKPGDRVRFAVYMEGWSSGSNDPYHSDLSQHMNFQVGIDPTGGNDPWSSNIVWTAPAESFDTFTQFVVEAVAQNNVVSVWTKSKPDLALQHVDVYVDEASLNVVQSSTPALSPKTNTRVITTTRAFTKAVANSRGRGLPADRFLGMLRAEELGSFGVAPVPAGPVTSAPSATPVPSAPAATPIPSTGSANIPDTYVVQRGDTLISIARRFGILPWWRLAEMNNLQEPYSIDAGQVLKLK